MVHHTWFLHFINYSLLKLLSQRNYCWSVTNLNNTCLYIFISDQWGVTGLGVVNAFGKLTDIISLHDLRGLQMDSESIWRLYVWIYVNNFTDNRPTGFKSVVAQ